MYEVAAKIAVKYGSGGRDAANYTENRIREFWTKDAYYPSPTTFAHAVKAKYIPWFIQNTVTIDHEILNPDFINGLTNNGKLQRTLMPYPTFYWNFNENVKNIIEGSGYGGEITKWIENGYTWKYVPAFHLKYSKKSLSYMAGLFAGGELCKKDGVTYARYMNSTKDCVRKWGIPFEVTTKYNIYISTFWPSLFSSKMPENIANIWLNGENSDSANLYAAILWKAYIDNDFPSNGIPHLKCRRWLFYHYKCKEGVMKKLEMLRLEKKLFDLDLRVKEAVQNWYNEYKDQKEENQ